MLKIGGRTGVAADRGVEKSISLANASEADIAKKVAELVGSS